ncbi:MAG: vanadium-dependent haloperoxidase [Ginsengibacter sp.]
MKGIFLMLFFFINILYAQSQKRHNAITEIQQQVWSITEVMYHDAINPPAAARFYAYSMLTGYEILSQIDSSANTFHKKLRDYPSKKFAVSPAVNEELAVLYGILETGKNIIPSGYLLEGKQQQLLSDFRNNGCTGMAIDSSVAIAKIISKLIVQYSRGDGYFSLSTKARYKPIAAPPYWKPTPPEYMAAVEPNWNTMRTFFIDSSRQFKPPPAASFNEDTSSGFMRLTKQVYETSMHLTDEQKAIADFWDCNPFAVEFQGHMSIGLKKISPGGHWMSITGIAGKKAALNFQKTMLLHTLVALTLHDAFISCWDEKYRSNRIRPETSINRYIDPKWKPFLQTPPFPEYSSGHSVISTASAEVLTYFLGDHFSFNDSTETYIGIPARKFSSFRSAAAEARISRLYGGIHFLDAIENGEEEGRDIGKFIIHKLQIEPFIK